MNPSPLSPTRIRFDDWSDDDETTRLALTGEPEGNDDTAVVEIDVRPALVTAIVTGCMFAYYQGPLSLISFIISGSYLAGRIFKKLTDGYSFMRLVEEWSLKLHQTIPYVQILAALLSVVFSFILVQLAYALATSSGLIGAVTVDPAQYRTVADNDAIERNLVHAPL